MKHEKISISLYIIQPARVCGYSVFLFFTFNIPNDIMDGRKVELIKKDVHLNNCRNHVFKFPAITFMCIVKITLVQG